MHSLINIIFRGHIQLFACSQMVVAEQIFCLVYKQSRPKFLIANPYVDEIFTSRQGFKTKNQYIEKYLALEYQVVCNKQYGIKAFDFFSFHIFKLMECCTNNLIKLHIISDFSVLHKRSLVMTM